MGLALPRLGELLEQAKSRKEVWAWDGVVPLGDLTLVAAFMKKGKTTLLTGLVNGWLKTGFYCGRPTNGVRKVLYLAPEEGDTLMKRFGRLGFGVEDEPALVVVPRGHPFWVELVRRYRMREWRKTVSELRSEGFDCVVLDGLHTMLQMFEPLGKEDNEGVTRFMSEFVLPMDGFTVVASLHTKKGGGDPKVHVPAEEMIRGASAWMAHPGQILVMEHDRKADVKRFHAFGRYEGSSAEGWVIRYDEVKRDYVPVVEGMEEEGFSEAFPIGAGPEGAPAPDEPKPVMVDLEGVKKEQTKAIIMLKVREMMPIGIRLTDLIREKISGRESFVRELIDELAGSGALLVEERGGRSKWLTINESNGSTPDLMRPHV